MNFKNRFISRILIDITNRCNLECIMCGVHFNKVKRFDMPLNLFKKISSQAFQYTESIWLSCGYEALMSKNFIEVIEYIKEVPFSVLITNGTLLNEINISKIIKCGLSRLFISFDGARKETFEKIRKGANFEKVISNIKLINKMKEEMLSLKPEVCFITTLMKSNIEELPLIVQYAHQLNINMICCKPVQIIFPGLKTEALENIKELAIQSFFQAESLAKKLGIKLEVTPDFLKLVTKDKKTILSENLEIMKNNSKRICGESLPILFISPEGLVKPCTMWKESYIGDFKSQNFWEIWEGDEFKKLRLEIESGNFRESCLNCRYLI